MEWCTQRPAVWTSSEKPPFLLTAEPFQICQVLWLCRPKRWISSDWIAHKWWEITENVPDSFSSFFWSRNSLWRLFLWWQSCSCSCSQCQLLERQRSSHSQHWKDSGLINLSSLAVKSPLRQSNIKLKEDLYKKCNRHFWNATELFFFFFYEMGITWATAGMCRGCWYK